MVRSMMLARWVEIKGTVVGLGGIVAQITQLFDHQVDALDFPLGALDFRGIELILGGLTQGVQHKDALVLIGQGLFDVAG